MQNRGFTIVELIVVIVVIGILAAITIVSYTGVSQRATASSLQSDLSNSSKKLKMYQVEYGSYPTMSAPDSNGMMCPTAPSITDIKYCIKPSSGNTFEYFNTSVGSSYSFKLNATKNGINYLISNDTSSAAGLYQPPSIVSDGLVLNLDVGDNVSYPSPFTGTSWNDISGNNNNGTLVNGVGYNSANNGSLTFDGLNDYVNIGDMITLNFNWATPFSVDSWIKTSQLANSYKIIYKKASAAGKGYVFALNHGKATLFLVNIWSGNMICVTSTNLVNDGNWHYVSATYDGSKISNGVRIYVDGVDQSFNIQNNLSADFVTSQPVRIADGTDWAWYSGQIGNIHVYNKVLSISEIYQNFSAHRNRYGI